MMYSRMLLSVNSPGGIAADGALGPKLHDRAVGQTEAPRVEIVGDLLTTPALLIQRTDQPQSVRLDRVRHQHAPVAAIGVPDQRTIAWSVGIGAFRAQAIAIAETRRAVGQAVLIANLFHLAHALAGQAQEEFGQDGDDEHDHAAGWRLGVERLVDKHHAHVVAVGQIEKLREGTDIAKGAIDPVKQHHAEAARLEIADHFAPALAPRMPAGGVGVGVTDDDLKAMLASELVHAALLDVKRILGLVRIDFGQASVFSGWVKRLRAAGGRRIALKEAVDQLLKLIAILGQM